MTGTLRVQPQQLITTADGFSTTAASVSTLTQQMTDTVNSLSSIWQGDAATKYVTRFNELNDDIQRIIKMINEHATDLVEMANTYITADEKNAELAQSLSADVII